MASEISSSFKRSADPTYIVICFLQVLGLMLLFEVMNTWLPFYAYAHIYHSYFDQIVQANGYVHATFIPMTLNLPMFGAMFVTCFGDRQGRVALYFLFRRILFLAAFLSFTLFLGLIFFDILPKYQAPIVIVYVLFNGWLLTLGFATLYLELYLIGFGKLRNIIVFRFIQIYFVSTAVWVLVSLWLEPPVILFFMMWLVMLGIAYGFVRWEFQVDFERFDSDEDDETEPAPITERQQLFISTLIVMYRSHVRRLCREFQEFC